MQATSKAEAALDSIRRHICLDGHADGILLHETDLARQFGMSRTPIRQVLQRLAYERLVQTRSGVGTISTPLHEAERGRDLTTYRGLLEAIRMHVMPPLTLTQQADIQVLRPLADALPPGDAGMQYELLSRLHGVLRSLVADPVLADAFSASFWRALRWHMRDLAADPERATARLRMQVSQIADHVTDPGGRQPGDLFARLGAGAADWATD